MNLHSFVKFPFITALFRVMVSTTEFDGSMLLVDKDVKNGRL